MSAPVTDEAGEIVSGPSRLQRRPLRETNNGAGRPMGVGERMNQDARSLAARLSDREIEEYETALQEEREKREIQALRATRGALAIRFA